MRSSSGEEPNGSLSEGGWRVRSHIWITPMAGQWPTLILFCLAFLFLLSLHWVCGHTRLWEYLWSIFCCNNSSLCLYSPDGYHYSCKLLLHFYHKTNHSCYFLWERQSSSRVLRKMLINYCFTLLKKIKLGLLTVIWGPRNRNVALTLRLHS